MQFVSHLNFLPNCSTKAFKVFAKSEKDFKFIEELNKNAADLNVTLEKPARTMNASFIFTIPECKRLTVLSMLSDFGVEDFEVFTPDPVIDTKNSRSLKRSNNVEKEIVFDPDIVTRNYISYEESNRYIDMLAEEIRRANPNIFVAVVTEGVSFEGREIKSITIRHTKCRKAPVILIDAGIHAREWHSRSMALYLLNRFVDEAAKDTDGLICQAAFVIVPNVNPDGYEFSRQDGNHMWRKTRRPVGKNCFGVDGNRNYDIHWSDGERERIPCTEVYGGANPFSEPETQTVKKIMERLSGKCKMYISIHTFGNTIIYPWGFTTNQHPRQQQLHAVAQAGVDSARMETGGVFVADQSGSGLVVACKICQHYKQFLVFQALRGSWRK